MRLTFAEPHLPCEIPDLDHSAGYAISQLYHGPCKDKNISYTSSSAALDSLRKEFPTDLSGPLLKGSFTPLDSRRIALPSDPQCMPNTWIPLLPLHIREMISSADGGMTNNLRDKIESVSICQLPRPRVWAFDGHYPKIIALASQAGMIEWSRVSLEPPQLRRIRDALTMSSFGVTKDESSDRLISWPRIQNEWFLPSPVPSFPDPSAFSQIFADQSPSAAGFALDVANMFHNIRLPSWLTSLFPLTPLLYKDMNSNLQKQVLSMLDLSVPPPGYTSFRPLQRTLPMRFTWAAFLGHSIAEGCLRRAVETFRRSSTLTYRAITISGGLRVVIPETNDIIIAHIIDDVNIVMYGCPIEDVRRLQHLLWRDFTMSGFPVRASKCTPLNRIETRSLPFIGFDWHLQTGIIMPKNDRTANLSRSINHLLDFPYTYQESDVERIVGKLVWTAMARRPLLSVLRSVFHLPSDIPRTRNRITAERELRMISALLPLAMIDTKRKIWPYVLAIDASEQSGAVTFTQSTRHNILALLSNCRYINGPLSHPDASSFALNSRWNTALTHEWRREEHINILEGESILLGLRWAIEKGADGHRVLF